MKSSIRVMKVRSCYDCIFSYLTPKGATQDMRVCGHPEVQLLSYDKREVFKTKFPDFCPLDTWTEPVVEKKPKPKKGKKK